MKDVHSMKSPPHTFFWELQKLSSLRNLEDIVNYEKGEKFNKMLLIDRFLERDKRERWKQKSGEEEKVILNQISLLALKLSFQN